MEKSVLTVRVEPETMEKLKALCRAEKRSQSKMIEIIIDSYNTEPAKLIEKPPVKPTATVKPVVLPVAKEPVRKFNLAEELAKTRQ